MAGKGGILGMFARSPIKPLEQHMNKALQCAQQLKPFVEAAISEDWSLATKLQTEISELEREADSIKNEFRLNLPKSLFLPVPRNDLLELLHSQDNVADIAKDIAGIMLGRKMKIPAAIKKDFVAYLQRSIDAAQQATKAINELDELLESGFRGREVELVATMVQELNTIEKDTDKMQINLRKQVYDIEKDLAAVDVMFLYKIIEWIGLLADAAQRTGSRLQMLTA